LALTAALGGTHPIILIAVPVTVFVAAWAAGIFGFSNSNNNVKLTSVIFPDGRVHLESGEIRFTAAVLDTQQWSTDRLAVLRIKAGGKRRNLLILASRQRDVDEFRRLAVWLRQDLCNNAGMLHQ
jgi:hypothetical protein